MASNSDPIPLPSGTPLCNACFSFHMETLQARKDVNNSLPCSQLFDSADNGCKTCQILAKAIRGLCPNEDPDKTHFVFYVGSMYGSGWKPQTRPDSRLWLLDPEVGATSRKVIELYRNYNDPCPWAFFLEAQTTPAHTASEDSRSWIGTNLNRCLTEHAECNVGLNTSALPTRVLDLGLKSADDDPVKVLETNGLRGRYMTLSHCWGDPDLLPTKLTARTLEEYTKGIPYDSLPLTFQHAVTFTRKLGVQYLWIDSLCILQRDLNRDNDASDQDWQREIGRMNEVYRNSYVTLAAASSTDCNGGLFFEAKTIDISVPEAADITYKLFARKRMKHFQTDFPLMKRGWVAQEYFLSPRTVLFGESELLWRCRKLSRCECNHGPAQAAKDEYYKFLEPNGVRPTRAEIARVWYEFINTYSQTALSYQTDRLAALEGIIQYMRPLRNSECLAGLWTDTFALDLLWVIGPRHRPAPARTAEPNPHGRRPVWSSREHLFPTWSWASVPCSVSWPGGVNFVQQSLPQDTFVTLVQDRRSNRPANEVTLRGILIPTTLGKVRRSDEGRKIFYLPDLIEEEELEDTADVYCLRVMVEHNDHWSLFLRCRDEARNVYERLGVVVFRRAGEQGFPEWWEPSEGLEAEYVTLTMV